MDKAEISAREAEGAEELRVQCSEPGELRTGGYTYSMDRAVMSTLAKEAGYEPETIARGDTRERR